MGIKQLDFGVLFLLLLIVGLGSISLLMQPATIRYEPIEDNTLIAREFDKAFLVTQVKFEDLPEYAPNGLTDLGLALRGKAWIEYPQYTAGLIAITILSFAGAIYAAVSMVKAHYNEQDTENEVAP